LILLRPPAAGVSLCHLTICSPTHVRSIVGVGVLRTRTLFKLLGLFMCRLSLLLSSSVNLRHISLALYKSVALFLHLLQDGKWGRN
jgi:hypothetical protein